LLGGNELGALLGFLLDHDGRQQALLETECDQPVRAYPMHQHIVPARGYPTTAFLILAAARLKATTREFVLQGVGVDVPRHREAIQLKIPEPHVRDFRELKTPVLGRGVDITAW